MTKTKLPSVGDPIDKHLLGRRSEGRVPVQHALECQGGRARHQAQLLDLSRNGARFTLLNPSFQAVDDDALVSTAERLSAEFGQRLTIRFVRHAIAINASLVRAARDPENGRTVVACSFVRALSPRECRLLQLDHTERNQPP
jgi:hypothetical protein